MLNKINHVSSYLEINLTGHRILWRDMMKESPLPVSGDRVPFAVLGEMILDCQNGTDRKTKAKEKYRQTKDNEIMVRKHVPLIF